MIVLSLYITPSQFGFIWDRDLDNDLDMIVDGKATALAFLLVDSKNPYLMVDQLD